MSSRASARLASTDPWIPSTPIFPRTSNRWVRRLRPGRTTRAQDSKLRDAIERRSLDVAKACLSGDEQAARDKAARRDAVVVYPATKAALAWWARTHGTTKEWAGAGVRVNAVAPGLIATAMTQQVKADPVFGRFADTYPTAIGRPGLPEEIAALAAFLLSEDASLLVGSVVYADGGTDALMHARRPRTAWVPAPLMKAAGKAIPVVARLQDRRSR